jgi:fatty acid desaturase
VANQGMEGLAISPICAALFGMNFEVYRHFHLQHHRAVCSDRDREGPLYAMSW